MVAAGLPLPPPLHHQKWTHADGGCLFATSPTSPIKNEHVHACFWQWLQVYHFYHLSACASFQWWPLVCHHHHHHHQKQTYTCPFPMVAACLPPPPPLCHRKWASACSFSIVIKFLKHKIVFIQLIIYFSLPNPCTGRKPHKPPNLYPHIWITRTRGCGYRFAGVRVWVAPENPRVIHEVP